jgi:hypothetical protein
MSHNPIHSHKEENKKIQESRKYPEQFKVAEFVDDYSYSNATQTSICVFSDPDNNEYVYKVLASNKGPTHPKQILDQFENRCSGESTEFGHEGGGNSRNIYGTFAETATIVSKVPTGWIFGRTRTNAIAEFVSNTDISDYNRRRTTSEFVDIPRIIEEIEFLQEKAYLKRLMDYTISKSLCKELTYFQIFKIKKAQVPKDYTDLLCWTKFNQYLSMKHYKDLTIFSYNELIKDDDDEPLKSKLKIIDVAGLDGEKTEERDMILLKNTETKHFALFVETSNEQHLYIDLHTERRTIYNSNNTKENAKYQPIVSVKGYVAAEEYIKKIHKDNSLKKSHHNMNSYYGTYIRMNGKLTSGLPIRNKLPDSKNNKILGNGTAYLRFLIEPIQGVSDELLKEVVNTDTIKAFTGLHTKDFPEQRFIKKIMEAMRGKYDTLNTGGGARPQVRLSKSTWELAYLKERKFALYKGKSHKKINNGTALQDIARQYDSNSAVSYKILKTHENMEDKLKNILEINNIRPTFITTPFESVVFECSDIGILTKIMKVMI